MSASHAQRVCLVLCFWLIVPAAAHARTLCASDSLNNTIVINTDADLAAGAIVGLHGRLSNGAATIPLHGTAVVDAAGAIAKIVLQGISTVDRHQHIGIAVDTDLMLNGSGTFDNVNAGRPYTYEIVAVIWTGQGSCPDPPSFAPLGNDAGPAPDDGKKVPD